MALVPVRSTTPVAGDHFETEVSEEWLDRFPDDFARLEGEDLARYELRRAGVAESRLDDAVKASLALAAAEPAAETEAETPDDAIEAAVTGEAAENPDPATPAV